MIIMTVRLEGHRKLLIHRKLARSVIYPDCFRNKVQSQLSRVFLNSHKERQEWREQNGGWQSWDAKVPILWSVFTLELIFRLRTQQVVSGKRLTLSQPQAPSSNTFLKETQCWEPFPKVTLSLKWRPKSSEEFWTPGLSVFFHFSDCASRGEK